MQDQIRPGQRVREIVTGLEGVVVAVATHLTGCDTVGIHPGLDKDRKPMDVQWFDYTRLAVIEERSIMDIPAPAKAGGPQDNPRVN